MYFLPIFIIAYEDEGFPNESLEIEREEEDINDAVGNHFDHSLGFLQLINKPTIY